MRKKNDGMSDFRPRMTKKSPINKGLNEKIEKRAIRVSRDGRLTMIFCDLIYTLKQ